MAEARHDKGRYEMAVRNCVNSILNGATYSVMRAKLQEDSYNIGKKYGVSQCDRIIRDARRRIKEDTQEMIPTLREDMISRALDVYTEARDLGDRFSALKALDMINKTFGLYENKLKIDGDVNSTVTINFGFNEDE